MVKPTFLGIGAQKCASSWIRNVLHDHPEVFVSHPREVDFFSYHYNRGYTWYERHFEAATKLRLKGVPQMTSPSARSASSERSLLA